MVSSRKAKVTDCLNEATQRLGDSLRHTEDELTRNLLIASASAVSCVDGVNGDSPTELTRSDINGITSTLMTADAKTIMQNIDAEDKFGTAPVRDAFIALGHTNLIGDLDNVAGFIQKNQYPNDKANARSEWGSVGNLRFFLSSVASISPNASNNGNDIYNISVIGLEAYACIEQDGASAHFIYRSPIYDGPLAQNCTLGWTMSQVPVITNDMWVVNLQATLSS